MINRKIHYFGAWAKRANGELVPVEDGGSEAADKEYTAKKATLDRLPKTTAALVAKAVQKAVQAVLSLTEINARETRESPPC